MAIPMFVKKSKKIKIEVFVYEDEDGHVEATPDKQDVPAGKESQMVTFLFKKPNYADSNVMIRQFQMANTVENVDVAALQEVAMHQMLMDWDLKDDSGQKVSLNRGNIEALEPAVGRSAALGYLGKIRF